MMTADTFLNLLTSNNPNDRAKAYLDFAKYLRQKINSSFNKIYKEYFCIIKIDSSSTNDEVCYYNIHDNTWVDKFNPSLLFDTDDLYKNYMNDIFKELISENEGSYISFKKISIAEL